MSIRDSNAQPPEHESSPITTRQGLLYKKILNHVFVLVLLLKYLNQPECLKNCDGSGQDGQRKF